MNRNAMPLQVHLVLLLIALVAFVLFTFFPNRIRRELVALHERWPILWRFNPTAALLRTKLYVALLVLLGLCAGATTVVLAGALVRRL